MSDSSALTATYRLQFNSKFRFSDAIVLVDYLSKLGISDIYASPIQTSRKGSAHGYDVTDPTQINPEIGSIQDFEHLQDELLKRQMRLVLDIVPNHMAASSENRWWMDVLENGYESSFASYFDIDWHPASRILEGRVLLPVLGRPFGEVLDRGEIRLSFENGKFFIRYFDSSYPVAPSSYHRLLRHRIDSLKDLLSENSPAYQEYSGIIAGLLSFAERTRIGTETESERRVRWDSICERLQHLVASNPEIAKFIEENVADFNGKPGDPASLCLLEQLLSEQKYRLAYWLDPNQPINYRRFFAISDLVGIRVEDAHVFAATHDQILRLTARNAIRGVRVDHIDGLRDPVGYLNRLSERLLEQSPESGPPYVLVEKILSQDESLPDDWQVSGTTGYEYLNAANGLFVSPAGASELAKGYSEFIGKEINFADVIYEKKKLVMNNLLRVEMLSLGRQLSDLAARDRYARNLPRVELLDVLIEVTACFPVYRTYIRSLEVSESSKIDIDRALDQARARRPELSEKCFSFLRDVLTLANPPHVRSDQREERLNFVMRWQQFTGPIVAKGIEDTALYVYYPLLSLNEVGGNLEPSALPSADRFFEFIRERQRRWPDTLNASSTHDTKRSEDLRARLNVLSEIPDQWLSQLAEWSKENAPKKTDVNGQDAPNANEEYLIYQTLLGIWPHDQSELPSIHTRLQAYVLKAIREAKIHTRWAEPNQAYEGAVSVFIDRIFDEQDHSKFLCSVAHFAEKIAFAGMLNALGQTLLKIACPGVPDFYQGSELWDFHLVDPDNRSPIDFSIRIHALEDLTNRASANPAAIASELLATWPDGRLKMYIIWKALSYRNGHAALFRDGAFVPLEVRGQQSAHVMAFLRRRGKDQAIAIVPRLAMNIPPNSDDSARADFWRETNIILPPDSPASWRDIFTTSTTEAKVEASTQSLPLADALKHFPIALLGANTAPSKPA